MKKAIMTVLIFLFCFIFLETINAEEKPSTPVLGMGSESFLEFKSGEFMYDLGVDSTDYEIGKNEEDDPIYSVDGYEVYEKVEGEYTKIGDDGAIGGAVTIYVEVGTKKTLVARVYVEDESHQRTYSDYSNELVLDHNLKAPKLVNAYNTFTDFDGEKYLFDLGIDTQSYSYGEESEEPSYFVDGYEVYVKEGNSYTKVMDTEMGGAATVEFTKGGDKVAVARVFAYNKSGDKVYSEYSNELVLKDSAILVENVIENFNNSDMIKAFKEFGSNIEAKLNKKDNKIEIYATYMDEENKNEVTEKVIEFNYESNRIYYSNDEELTEEAAENSIAADLMIAQMMQTIFDLSDCSGMTLKEDAPIDKEDSFEKYGIQLIGEDYKFEEETEDGTSTFSGTFIRNFEIVLDSSKIKDFINEYGEKVEDSSVPSGLAPRVITSEVSSTSVSVGAIVDNAEDEDYMCYIYRSKEKDGEYTLIDDMTINCTGIVTFEDNGLEPNTTYYYKAMIFGGDTFSDVVSIKTLAGSGKIETAPVVKVSKGNNNSLVISWNKISEAEAYIVLRSDKKTGKYKELDTVETNEYIDNKLTYGKTYYYKVLAYNKVNKKTSAAVSGKAKPNKVENVKFVSSKTNYVKLSWDKVGVTGYEVYRSTKEASGFKKVATITKSKTVTYKNKGLKANTKYYYKIRAYKIVSGKKIYGKYSEVITTKTAPKAPKITLSNKDYDSLNINVKKSSGTSEYIIYRSNSKKGTYVEVGKLEAAGTYKDTELVSGKTYYYKVKACNSNNNCSDYSSVVSKKVIPGKPKFTVTLEEKELKIEVTSMEGSTGYEVYQSKSKNSGYKKVSTLTEDLTYTNTLKKGTYYYKVRTYVTVNGKKVYGKYTSVKTVKVK